MAQWSTDEVYAYLAERINEGFAAGCLQKALYFSSEPTIGLEHISEHLESNINEIYYCKLCNVAQDPSKMYNHIIGRQHRMEFFILRNTANSKNVNLSKSIRRRAERYEKNHGRHCGEIKVFEKSARKIFSKHVAAQKTQSQEARNSKSRWPKNLNAINNTSSYDHPPEQLFSNDVPQCSYDDYYKQQLQESYRFNIIVDQSYQGKNGKYSNERSIIINTVTPNTTEEIQEDVCENPETTNYPHISDDDDANSVISISSSTSIDVCMSDMEEQENDQTTNYNFNNSYDVAQKDQQQVSEANWNPTKMECLQLFMEQSEPLVIETQSQWELVVSVIQAVSEAVEKCNVQNLPP